MTSSLEMRLFDREDYLNHHIPYRMHSIAWFVRVLRGTRGWRGPRKMEVYIDGKRCIEGTHYGLTNPSIEIGIIYSRVLLEFLGLRANRSKTGLVPTEDKMTDTIRITDFASDTGPLQKITVQEALACCAGPCADAELSLVTVLAHADKAVAHLTPGPAQDEHTIELLAFGGERVLELMSHHLYGALGREIPDYKIKVHG